MSGFAAVGLWNPKNAMNVGGVLRAASCYDVRLLALGGSRPRRLRMAEDTVKAWRTMPLLCAEDLHDLIPYDAVPVAVECQPDAMPLPHYQHPKRAFYVFGPEDGSLPGHVLAWCRHIVQVPTRHCMNLAATVNVVLYDRMAKHVQRGGWLEVKA